MSDLCMGLYWPGAILYHNVFAFNSSRSAQQWGLGAKYTDVQIKTVVCTTAQG